MTQELETALSQLKSSKSDIPLVAIGFIRDHWSEAEPSLLAEMDRCIEQPLKNKDSALLFYALFLCAEMSSEAAFTRYLKTLRLPNLLLDFLLGDIVTSDMEEMLARTCCGRIDDLKALIEDETVYEFARSAAMEALQRIQRQGDLDKVELEQYCVELLTDRLERRPSYIWDAAVSMAIDLGIKTALPLIERAYENRLTDESFRTLAEARSKLSLKMPDAIAAVQPRTDPKFYETADKVKLHIKNWQESENNPPPDNDQLLGEARLARLKQNQPKAAKIGRNEPCPCGSGKKYKKCCIDKPSVPSKDNKIDKDDYSNSADEWIAAGYYYETTYPYRALACWQKAWLEVKKIIPMEVQDPMSDECNHLFNSCDFFSNWLQDYQLIIEKNMKWDADMVYQGLKFCQEVVKRFPKMVPLLKMNFSETTIYLLLSLGRKAEAFSLLEKLIEENPGSAQGYAVKAELLTFSARQYNLRPDFTTARRLLLQALEKAADCDDWDIEKRLENLPDLGKLGT